MCACRLGRVALIRQTFNKSLKYVPALTGLHRTRLKPRRLAQTLGILKVNLGGISIKPPTEAEGFLVAAEGVFAGVEGLYGSTPIPNMAFALLCGHSCEAALKAILASSGRDSEELRKAPFGHNLIELWKSAAFIKPSLGATPPQWLESLNKIFDRPFHLRYPLGLHGISYPSAESMFKGTSALVDSAASEVRGRTNT